MVDFHTHILPRLDDGAKDSRISVAMLESERSQGVSTILCTPHFYGKRHTPARFIERRNAAYERIKDRIPQGISVRLGAEVYFTGVNVMEEDDFCSLAIEGTKYVLVELPFDETWHGQILERLAVLIADTGYTPIIAHVERYDEVRKNPAILTKLIQMGCLIQVNGYAFLQKEDKALAFALLKHGIVDCVGSDAHDLELRRPNLAEAKAAVLAAGYAAEWERIQENMRKILQNERVSNASTTPVKKFLWWYF